MLRAMYTSISGLRNHQALLDTTANNIANVNTFGFKASQTTFKDILSQTVQGASAPNAMLGGTNNMQIGLGMTVEAITQRHTQGSIQSTGVPTDLAISGDGFFRVTNDISNVAIVGEGGAPTYYQRAGNLQFDANGSLVTKDGFHVMGYPETLPAGSGVPDTTQYAVINVPQANAKNVQIGQNGMVSYTDTTSNSLVVAGWITMAKFPNPSGLTQVGDSKWQMSQNSGAEIVDNPGGTINGSGMGSVMAGALEMSNVDLATEFTEMIKAQRGFQANSRTITTSDEILQELVNLKR